MPETRTCTDCGISLNRVLMVVDEKIYCLSCGGMVILEQLGKAPTTEASR